VHFRPSLAQHHLHSISRIHRGLQCLEPNTTNIPALSQAAFLVRSILDRVGGSITMHTAIEKVVRGYRAVKGNSILERLEAV